MAAVKGAAPRRFAVPVRHDLSRGASHRVSMPDAARRRGAEARQRSAARTSRSGDA
jgi:hypothetical protein